MSLVGFTRLGSLTAPSVTGSAADLPTLVKFEDFTSTMLASLDVGGGDLRFSSDLAGATQLACEVVTFTKATGDVVWVKVPSVSTGALIYVWGDNTGATQPAVGAAFGRNAVWSDFEVNYHFNSAGVLIDATGNHDLTQFGSPTSVAGQVGDAVSCAGDYANRFEAVGYKGITGNSARTVTLWSKNTVGGDRGISTWGADGSGIRWSVWLQGGKLRTEITGSFRYTNTAASDGTYKRLSAVYDGSTFPAGVTHRTNGVSDASYTSGGTVAVNTGSTADLIVGGYSNLATVQHGSNQTDEFAIRAFALSQEQDLIEYDNQSATGAWWTAADEGGGGPVTQILTPTAIASEENFGTPSLATGLVTVTAIGIASEEAVGSVSLSTGATLLTPEDIVSQEVLGDPNLLVGATALTTESITTEEALGLISLLSQSVVLVSSITSEEIVGNPELAYEQTISVVSAHTGETMGRTTVLGGVVVISLNTVYRDVMSDVYRTTMRDGYDIRT